MTTPAMPELPDLQDFGPWHVSHDGKYIDSDNFNHDVKLVVQGDFRNDEQRRRYALDIAKRLSRPALSSQPSPELAGVSDEPTDEQIAAGMRELFAGPKPWPSWESTLKRVYAAMVALRPAQQAYPLPDDLYDSKDWRQGNYASRVEWLHTMYEHAKHERDEYAAQLEALRPQSVPMTLTPTNDIGLVPVAVKPFTPAQRRRLWNNSPEIHKDATSITGFERIVSLTERAHGITAQGAQGEQA